MRTATILLLSLLAGCAPVIVWASPLAAFHPPAVLVAMGAANAATCRIDAERDAGLVQVVGIVRAEEDMVANARLQVRRTSSAGTANSAQGGVFSVRAGEEAVVGRVAINADADSDLWAELTVQWDGGQTSCRYP